MRALIFCAGLALCACSTMNAQTDIAAIEVGLTGAETAAKVYAQLPSADPAIVAKIKTADQAAYATVKAAEAAAKAGASPDLTASVAALTALQALIPTGAKP